MPTRSGTDRSDFIRIDGAFHDRDRINTGVLPGFACGLNVVIPETFLIQKIGLHPTFGPVSAQATPVDLGIVRKGNWLFINASPSSQNTHNSLNLYIAVHIQSCETEQCAFAFAPLRFNGSNFGFFEVVSSDIADFDDFVATVLAKNDHRTFTSEGENEYETFDGRIIQFTPNDSGDGYRWGIKGLNGQRFDTNIHNWPLVRGDIMNTDPKSDGHNGYVTVDNPYLKERLVLDMRDPMIPRRYQFRIDAPRHMAGALVSRDIYRLDAFWIGLDGSVNATNWDRYINQGTWALPILLTRPGLARSQSPLVAVARTSENLDVFWIGQGSAICTNWRGVGANGNEWNLPFNIPGIPTSDGPSDSSGLAVVSRVPEQLDLFWIGADGAVRTQWWNGSFADGAWDRHGAFQITPTYAARLDSPISAIARKPENLDVFWIAPDGSVCTQWWAAGGDNGKWDQHSFFMIAPPGSARSDSAITSVAKVAGHIDVFWIGSDGAVWSHWWDEGASDGRWDQRTPFIVTPPNSVGNGSGLASVARVPNHVDLFWVTPQGAIASTFWDDNSPQQSWIGPFDVTRPGVAQAHSPVYAFGREPEHLDVVWVGPENALWTHWWDARGDDGRWDQHQPFAVTPPNSVEKPL